jgi:hypothetical protein
MHRIRRQHNTKLFFFFLILSIKTCSGTEHAQTATAPSEFRCEWGLLVEKVGAGKREAEVCLWLFDPVELGKQGRVELWKDSAQVFSS